ncbi:TWiK family of potassium channels protein 18 [Contarinia nasturtii]|uniref:TWiK family of potassium channels protein 18 n=1 Tax=Contarinia nasturtii TaxID=265458 RepID=UPI0012D40D2F|nr:TWiK family of potassium channels protein 18 [Contarinia nasturtii]
MERQRSFKRRHNMPKPPLAERAKEHCRQFTAFLFSNVGIIILVVLYMTSGASMFKAIEGDVDLQRIITLNNSMTKTRGDVTNQLWDITLKLNNFNQSSFINEVDIRIQEYQQKIVLAFHDGWMGSNSTSSNTWTFPNSLLYSLTVITTIGYGNITPRTSLGKTITIIYAIVGMPLFLLYLSNIGDIMAKSFKWIYAKVCLCRICPGVAKRREARNRRKMRALQRQLNQEYGADEEDDDYISEESISLTSVSSSSSTKTSENKTNPDDTSSSTSESTNEDLTTVSVPISVCLMIMICYILFGAIIFLHWESNWRILTGCYFCFISLSSIGFGDILPGDKIFHVKKGEPDSLYAVDIQFIICAMYLLLGMALIAMCFNLMQEQVINNIRAFKRCISGCFRCHRCKSNHDFD